MLFTKVLAGVSALAVGAHASPSKSSKICRRDTASACKELAHALGDRVVTVLALDYEAEMQDYWSVTLRTEKPKCMVLPHTADETATAVKILLKYPDVKFAIKSGGHSPNVGHATAKDGVLISTGDMVGATYDAETGLAHVKPGGEWNDVISQLQEQGVTMLGGRLGVVGVGGLLLQGGLSFLSSQYGMASDNIVEWTLVTANGTVRKVKASEEPELAVAMRGGGSQFGIVTEYAVRAYERPEVWGGSRVYLGKDKINEVLAAAYQFTAENEDDTKAAIIPATQVFAPGGELGPDFLLLYIFYDGSEPPTSGPLAKLLDIKPSTDNTKTQSYPALLKENGAVVGADQSRYQFRTATVPYLKEVPDMLEQIYDKLQELMLPIVVVPTRLTGRCGVGFQPLPAIISKESRKRGGNAMGLEDDVDRIVLEIQCGGWLLPVDDPVFAKLTSDLVSWLEEKVVEWTGGKEYYLPYFMNDAAGDQDVMKSYRDYEKFKALQKREDPDGFFSKRAGGFKY